MARTSSALSAVAHYALTEAPGDAAYLHAQFRRTNPLPFKQDYVVLDGVRGRGHYVGTYVAWGVNNSGWWGEGGRLGADEVIAVVRERLGYPDGAEIGVMIAPENIHLFSASTKTRVN
jgi:Protein of unknown function (DUF2961)